MLLSSFFSRLAQEAAEHAAGAAETAEKTAGAAEHAGGHAHPWLVEQVYHLTGLNDHSLPPHVLFAIVSALICIVGLRLMAGKMSVDKPGTGQQILEVAIMQVRGMVDQGMGHYGYKYLSYLLPLGAFILISNLMGLIPIFEAPTANINSTLPLGVLTFLYFVAMGFGQQGIGYLGHFFAGLTKGPLVIVGAIVFFFELLSTCIRPGTLGLRLTANLYADEQIAGAAGKIFEWILPVAPMFLGTFVAVVQTFVFLQLTIVYLGETVPHDDHH